MAWYITCYCLDMAATLPPRDAEDDAPSRRAGWEAPLTQEVVQSTLSEYVEHDSRADSLLAVLGKELPQYSEALDRLGR